MLNTPKVLSRVSNPMGIIARAKSDQAAKKTTPELSEASRKLQEFSSVLHRPRAAPLDPSKPARVVVTGASGQISYSLLFRIASGDMLGPNQPVILQLLELPDMMGRLEGVVMELQDAAFPLVKGIVSTSDVNKAFEGADVALLVGAKPRSKGQERKDLLHANANIFAVQGEAMNKHANRDTIRALVVGNPANTNALILHLNSPDIPFNRITAMTKLDHNRGLAQLADKLNVKNTDIERFCIWGNHSSTQYPDVTNAIVKGRQVTSLVSDEWVTKEFIPNVQQRGAAIINARGSSSAASAAHAAAMHIRDWVHGTNGQWTSMGVFNDVPAYGVDPELCYSYPVVCSNGDFTIVPNVPITEFSAERMELSRRELIDEAKVINSL